MSGLAPLSYDTLNAWATMRGVVPSWLEVEALFQLDAVMRSPKPPAEPKRG